MNNINDLIFTIEAKTNKSKDEVKKMQKKMLVKASENVKRIMIDKLDGRMGEC